VSQGKKVLDLQLGNQAVLDLLHAGGDGKEGERK
jgi:hypothetical protein